MKGFDRMKMVKKSILIDTSPEKLWELLSADRIMDWSPYMAKTKKFEYKTPINSPEDKLKPGTIANFDITCFHEVVNVDRHKEVKYKIYEKNILGYCEGFLTFTMEHLDNDILFTYSVQFHKPSGFYGNAIYFFTHKWLEKSVMKSLQCLKELLENQSET